MANYKVAYGRKENMQMAIELGIIPPGCIILTEDSSEIFFYDLKKRLTTYESKTKFSSRLEAEAWIKEYDCSGQIITIREGNICSAYIVDYEGRLAPISSGASSNYPSGVRVQADFLIEDPYDPAYIKNKPTSYPISFIDGLAEVLTSKVRITNSAVPGALMLADSTGNIQGSNITLQSLMSTIDKKVEIDESVTEGSLLVADGSGGLKSAGFSPQDIFSSVEKKVEIVSDITPGSLLVATEDGNLQCSGISTTEIFQTMEKKVEIVSDVTPGSLMVATPEGNLQCSGVTVSSILEDIEKKPEILEDVIPGSLLIATEDGNLQCSGLSASTILESLESIEKKVEITSDIIPGSLLVATESGDLKCSGVSVSDILRVEDIITGSLTSTVTIGSSGEYIVQIPQDVLVYPSVHVYHNGMLLVEYTHYTRSGDFITLIGHSTYSGDLFTFVGYGSTGSLSEIEGCHTHPNKNVLDSITQDMVDAWNSGSPSNKSLVSREELFGTDGLILPDLIPVSTNAQENMIEQIAIGSTVLPIVDKCVTIPVGNEETLGVVKSSIGTNKVYIEDDGTMTVSSIDAKKLIVPEGEELILVSGDSNK